MQRYFIATPKPANAGTPKNPARLEQAAKCWRKAPFPGTLHSKENSGEVTRPHLYLYSRHTAAQPFGQADLHRLGPAPGPVVIVLPRARAVGVRLPQTLARTLETPRTSERFGICDHGALRPRPAKTKTKKYERSLLIPQPAGPPQAARPLAGGAPLWHLSSSLLITVFPLAPAPL